MVVGCNDVMKYYCVAQRAKVRMTHAVERDPPPPKSNFSCAHFAPTRGEKNSKYNS